ncbi:hypothetical protein QX201_007382 [Fusarium graminearum]
MGTVFEDPNEKVFVGSSGTRYMSTRLVVHAGVTVSIALRDAGNKRLVFEYAVLDPSNGSSSGTQSKSQDTGKTVIGDALDSQGWSESPLALPFPSEVRVVGEEAIPNWSVPPVDTGGVACAPEPREKLDFWLSTTLSFTENVPDFEVLSDGKYIYLFRQGIQDETLSPGSVSKNNIGHYVNGNLLCDRYILSGGVLTRPLEVRYRRSGQKSLMLNDRDTLGVSDINDNFFYEPTLSLKFAPVVRLGSFSVLRVPTMSNDSFRWMFFLSSLSETQIDHYTCDVSSDGLFDLRGKVYYSCNKNHDKVFSTESGQCTATGCDKPLVPLVPAGASSGRAVVLGIQGASTQLALTNEFQLISPQVPNGVTVEAWIQPSDLAIPAGSFHTIFGMKGPSVVLDEDMQLALTDPSNPSSILWSTGLSAKKGEWNHVALIISIENGKPNAKLVVNDEASKDFVLGVTSMSLKWVGSLGNSTKVDFCGSIDEIRIWSYSLDPKTISCNKNSTPTGTEALLAACWHCDEGNGGTLYDSTATANHIIMLPKPSEGCGWTGSQAPVRRNAGLTKRILRVNSGAAIVGGISAGMYYEQVSFSAASTDQKASNTSSELNASNRTEEKPLKRNARVLVCSVAMMRGGPSQNMFLLDFGLLSDGTLGGLPGEIGFPVINLDEKEMKASTELLFTDPEGTELFGAFLAFQAGYSSYSPPQIWETAAGGITIYFQTGYDTFGALPYSTSRGITVGVSAKLGVSKSGEDERVMAASKLRTANSIKISTEACIWADSETVLNLSISATKPDKSIISEQWKGLPCDFHDMCSIINGLYTFEEMSDTTVASCSATATKLNAATMTCYNVAVTTPLTKALSAGTCLKIGRAYVQTAATTAVNSTVLLVTSPYSFGYDLCKVVEPLEAKPGEAISFLGYDYTRLVTCELRGSTSKAGSSLVSLNQKSSIGELPSNNGSKVSVPAEVTIPGSPETPYFSSSGKSRALKLSGETTLSTFHLRNAATDACSGLTFESWIKVDRCLESVIVSYTTQKRRSGSKENEAQTFILAVAPTTEWKYALEGNINEKYFRIEQSSLLQINHWVHTAISYQNLYSLRFNGGNYVQLGNASEFNLSNFSMLFHLQLSEFSADRSEQILLSKAESPDGPAPYQVSILRDGGDKAIVQLRFWLDTDNDKVTTSLQTIKSKFSLENGKPYIIFVSREIVNPNAGTTATSPSSFVTLKAWPAGGDVTKPSATPPVEMSSTKQSNDPIVHTIEIPAPCGETASTEAPLRLGGGLPNTKGIVGQISGFKLWSISAKVPDDITNFKFESLTKSLLGSYSFTSTDDKILRDDCGRYHGTLREKPDWTSSPFPNKAPLSIYINGKALSNQPTTIRRDLLKAPIGPHQLTIGNSIHGDSTFRYMASPTNFMGQLDELRIWEVAKSRESICDAYWSKLTDVPPEIAVYFPFEEVIKQDPRVSNNKTHSPIIADMSNNNWNLSVVHDHPLVVEDLLVSSAAPVGRDAACVAQLLHGNRGQDQGGRDIISRPSVVEYGDLTIGPNGAMDGSFKRAYTFVTPEGSWVLITGFKIGTLVTEWFSQVQTAPTLIGYIEGAPPVPAENWTSKDDAGDDPLSSIKFVNAQSCSYSYSSRKEDGSDTDTTIVRGAGAKWEASAGLGVSTQISEGEIKAGLKTAMEISSSSIDNEVSTTTSHNTIDVQSVLSGKWTKDANGKERFEPNNTGIALVESEVADVFALRLKLQGPTKPLVAYQMRPNTDIPKDRNLVSFRINPYYTKQGCIDGKHGSQADTNFPQALSSGSHRDLSYFKPVEAYAIRDRIRRAEEQLAGEYERFQCSVPRNRFQKKSLPKRSKRNICNSYVWTADGGTFQETNSTMDFVQQEVGGSMSDKVGLGLVFDMEISMATVLQTANVDSLFSTHFNMMLTKEHDSENSFELQATLPPPVDVKDREGAVDSYRWMSFWLEPHVDATAAFFQQVVDRKWLQESTEGNAATLRSLEAALKAEKADAKTKAWRVFHRCTYVSRVLEKIVAPAASVAPKAVLFDQTPNWGLICALEPYLRSAKDKNEVREKLQPLIDKHWPVLQENKRIANQLVDILVEYLGVS